MMKIILFFASLFASGQAIQIDRVTADPPGGACNARANWRWNQVNDKVWACDGTSWKLVGTAGVTPGTVTSVAFSTNLGTVSGSPVTNSGTITDTISASQIVSLFSTCSGVQYLGADGSCHSASAGITSISTTSPITGGPITTTGTIACATCVTSSVTLTSNLPIFGNGGKDTIVGTRSGNTTAVVTTTGTQTAGHCVDIDANGNHVDSGASCGSGGGGIPGVTSPPATWADSINNTTLVAGSFTLGTKVLFTAASGAMKGIKFAWKTGAGAKTVLVTLWDLGLTNTGGSSLGTATIAVNATGLYEADFGSPITLTQFHYYTVAFWENSGAFHTQDTVPEASPTAAFSVGSFVYTNLGLFVAGNAQPTTTTTDRYPVEAVLN